MLKQLIKDGSITSDDTYLTYAIAKLSYLEYVRNNRVIISYVDVLNQIFNFSESEIESRAVFIEYWDERPGQLEDGSWALIAKRRVHIAPCGGGQGPGAGRFPPRDLITDPDPDPDGGGNSNNNEDINVENPLEELDIDEDCINLLTNDAIEIARDLAINTTFPCDDRTDEDVLNDILNDLCDQNNSEVNNGPGGSSLIAGLDLDLENDLVSGDDVEEAFDGYETIPNDQMERLSQCFTDEQICEFINFEKSGLTEEQRNAITDCWPNWWKFNLCRCI